MKKCTKCGIEKELSEFYAKRGGKDSQCKVCKLAYNHGYYLANRSQIIADTVVRNRTPKIRQARAKRARCRRKEDPQYALANDMRRRVNLLLAGTGVAGSGIQDVGCTLDQLAAHLEAQFLPGMTWDNRARDGWHIDHIKPLAMFDLTNREQFLEACHYTNLQPMWATDNLSKGARYDG